MTFDSFGSGQHKIEIDDLLAVKDGVLLDVRDVPEQESLRLTLKHHLEVLRIPPLGFQSAWTRFLATRRSAYSVPMAPGQP
jgi:hypothetical protein